MSLDREQAIGVSYCILLAIVLWTVIGFTMVVSAQRQIKRWGEIEVQANNYVELARMKDQYETIYYNIVRNKAGKPQQFDFTLIEKIRYFIMRL